MSKLYEIQRALGVAPEVLTQRIPVAEVEQEPDPVVRTNYWNDGRDWEEHVKAIGVDYARAGVLTLEKVNPASRIIGGGAARKVIFMSTRLVDFVGVWTARGGRAIFLEAKSTQEARLPLGRPGGLTAAQVAGLRLWTLSGAAAGLLWRCDEGVFWAPYRDIEQAVVRGQKSLRTENCQSVVPGPKDVVVAGAKRKSWNFELNLSASYPRKAV